MFWRRKSIGLKWLWSMAMAVPGLVIIAVTPTHAATEFEKFKDTVPADTKYAFHNYSTCALTNRFQVENEARDKGAIAKFSDVQNAIEKLCTKELDGVRVSVKKFGFSAADQEAIIKRGKSLVIAEQRLQFERKPIPGHVQDPWVASVSECIRKMDVAKTAYVACTDEAARNLVPLSSDTSDVVADAVMGLCQSKREAVARGAMCLMSPVQAEDTVSRLSAKLRSQLLGQIAAARAELRRRQLLEAQSPKPDQTSPKDARPVLERGI
jgi:hypothetical protein